MSKTAVITGATSGIGAEYARRLAEDGYNLIITGRRKEVIERLADELRQKNGIDINVIIAELSDDNDIQKVIDTISGTDDIEMLINNAGYFNELMPCMNIPLDDHEKMIKVHQVTPLRLIYAVVPEMVKRGKGAIINVSSVGTCMPEPKAYVYTATKSFVKQYTEGLHKELEDKGIKVQVLCPAFTVTDFYRQLPENAMDTMKNKSKVVTRTIEETVDRSLKDLRKNKPVCFPGGMIKFIYMLYQAMPRKMVYNFGVRTFDLS